MSSYVTLALAAAPAAPAFNSNFYITAATVIPVLFVALAIQENSGYKKLLQVFGALDRLTRSPHPWCQRFTATIAGAVLIIVAYAILVFGVVIEAAAVYALYQQQVSSSTAAAVLVGTIFMVIATATGPALGFGRVLLLSFRDDLQEELNLMRQAGLIRGRPPASPPPEHVRPAEAAPSGQPGASQPPATPRNS